MDVTHIMRGDEFVSSTPRFLSLYDALGMTPPVFATLPPILKDDRSKKLGKRDGAKDILEYRTEGYLPEAMVNFLALIGWNPGGEEEVMDKQTLIERFSLEHIQKGGGAFNEEKLNWMNKAHLAKLSDDDFLARAIAGGFFPKDISINDLTKDSNKKTLALIREKIQVFKEIPALFSPEGELSFIACALEHKSDSLIWKGELDREVGRAKTKTHLQMAIDTVTAVGTGPELKTALWPYAEAHGKGNVLWPVRFALSGKDRSPDPFIMAEILGKDETLRRLTSAYNAL